MASADDISMDDVAVRRAELRKLIQEHMQSMSEHVGDFEKFSEVFKPPFWTNRVLLLVAVPALISVFAFFGLKLYRSLSERERKRDEKRRLKQQKKKK